MKRPANYHEVGPDTQADIIDIDSIIEINGHRIVTTAADSVIYHGGTAKRNNQRRPRRRSRNHHYRWHKHRYRYRHHPPWTRNSARDTRGGIPVVAKRVNGREPDLLSFPKS